MRLLLSVYQWFQKWKVPPLWGRWEDSEEGSGEGKESGRETPVTNLAGWGWHRRQEPDNNYK